MRSGLLVEGKMEKKKAQFLINSKLNDEIKNKNLKQKQITIKK
jgi:hypothetical protein